MNEIFRRSVNYSALSWERLDDLHRQSKIVAADHLLMKTRILLKDETITKLTVSAVKEAYNQYCESKSSEEARKMYRKLEHMRSYRFYAFYNWNYGLIRDDTERQHPMLRPFEELTEEQQQERDAAWELMGRLYGELE